MTTSVREIHGPPPQRRWVTPVGIVLLVLWVLALPAACIVSVDLCDIGAQLSSEGGNPFDVDSCGSEVHDRRVTALAGLALLLAATVVVGLLATRKLPAGWYRPPDRDARLLGFLRFWDGASWTSWLADPIRGTWGDGTTWQEMPAGPTAAGDDRRALPRPPIGHSP